MARQPYFRLSTTISLFFSTILCTTAALAQTGAASEKEAVRKNSKPPVARSADAPVRRVNSAGVTNMSALPEVISVHGGMSTSNGVTNTTPGGGLMPRETAPRSQSGVTRDYIAKQTPTTSIVNLMNSLPGVVSARVDPLGMTPGDMMTMRGMTQSQIGFLFEGAPEADPINYGVSTSTLVDSENLGSLTVSQGSPDIDAPLINAAGG